MACIRCGDGRTRRDGHTRLGGQRWRCKQCRRRFTARSTSAFSEKKGKKLSAMGPVPMRITGSPDPMTSYSNSAPFTFARSMALSSTHDV